jgi:hypothetical protein
MSSDPERDIGDYVTDNSQHEEGSLFLPAPEGNSDPWALFFAGILMGLAGGVLVPVSAWVAGALIVIGYGLTALSLKGSARRFARALCFGFAITAVLGAALFAGEIAAPAAFRRLISVPANLHLIFAVFALMPWALGLLKFVHALIWRPRRRTKVRAP